MQCSQGTDDCQERCLSNASPPCFRMFFCIKNIAHHKTRRLSGYRNNKFLNCHNSNILGKRVLGKNRRSGKIRILDANMITTYQQSHRCLLRYSKQYTLYTR